MDLNANELENNDSICTNNFSNGDDILTEEIPGEEISSSPGVAEPEGLDAGNEVIVDTAIIAEINNNDNVINVPLEAVTNDVETLEGKIEGVNLHYVIFIIPIKKWRSPSVCSTIFGQIINSVNRSQI